MKTDVEIQQHVLDEIAWDPILRSSSIGVRVRNGLVTLVGYVPDYGKKLAAERAVKRVEGVRAVIIELEIMLPQGSITPDEQIAEAVLKSLMWNSIVPDDLVTVKVENGWVTLEGEVEWQYQRESAGAAIENLVGVKGVSNQIKVVPSISSMVVKDGIRKALERSATVEANGIQVVVEGGDVVLRGKVRSWGERGEVEQAAWATPGVTAVKDELVIAP
ncbi:BON domain-containing protein [Chitinophaga sedimenti]|uniref:BON domain-containing protein n=1 Tax=Chitinophaga sedimenti TaxID=2033606 RepID=UPI0020043882|nr:BON domain-containing protein [Chitinophaga sedimenti]MCK7557163.1 BON domain-containing protein [Chitinophaga sedimenti]